MDSEDSRTPRLYSHRPILTPITPSIIASYRSTRLLALGTDPSAFGSNYNREVVFTDDIWTVRLEPSERRSWITLQGVVQPEGDSDWFAGGEAGVATMTILSPCAAVNLPLAWDQFEKTGLTADWDIFIIHGMWVDPAHRGRDVAVELLKTGKEWARGFDIENWVEGEENQVSGSLGSCSKENGCVPKKRMLALNVTEGNAAAHAFYRKVGFVDAPNVPTPAGQSCMVMEIG
ncbi:hypothetical protein CONPUDRAFT_165324 [Coniophora puteana RWD-64-598 SS2]|uniref:N-acetyltransferase domain-containing protein n=1 Tax=Coniophora puteana (strain RWD-64-598) TaxID=741705 RepID=A0A5M3MPQ0_CONPW|nr:uncharacterized protein CONPUDRAFT_165324 [Coniophora puteana RWD-64-598 SS2]EIW81103.1 hypothetical protein CONPUDRAFT_165324 [Coniophora puteana RWD-64-598 SS2]